MVAVLGTKLITASTQVLAGSGAEPSTCSCIGLASAAQQLITIRAMVYPAGYPWPGGAMNPVTVTGVFCTELSTSYSARRMKSFIPTGGLAPSASGGKCIVRREPDESSA